MGRSRGVISSLPSFGNSRAAASTPSRWKRSPPRPESQRGPFTSRGQEVAHPIGRGRDLRPAPHPAGIEGHDSDQSGAVGRRPPAERSLEKSGEAEALGLSSDGGPVPRDRRDPIRFEPGEQNRLRATKRALGFPPSAPRGTSPPSSGKLSHTQFSPTSEDDLPGDAGGPFADVERNQAVRADGVVLRGNRPPGTCGPFMMPPDRTAVLSTLTVVREDGPIGLPPFREMTWSSPLSPSPPPVKVETRPARSAHSQRGESGRAGRSAASIRQGSESSRLTTGSHHEEGA